MFNALENYKQLLLIRRKGFQQMLMFTTAILILVVIGPLVFMFARNIGSPENFQIDFVPLFIFFALMMGNMMIAAKREAVDSSIELIENLQKGFSENLENAKYERLHQAQLTDNMSKTINSWLDDD